jgi:hypothetical protein
VSAWAFLAGEDCVDELIEFDFFHARSGLGEKGLTEYDLRALGVPTVGIHSGVVDTAEWGADRDASDSRAAQYGVQPCYLVKPEDCMRDMVCLKRLEPAVVTRIVR